MTLSGDQGCDILRRPAHASDSPQAWRKNIDPNDQNDVWDDQNQFGTPLGDLGTSLDARKLEI